MSSPDELFRKQMLHDLVMLMLEKEIDAERVDHSATGYLDRYRELMNEFEVVAPIFEV